MRELLLAGVAYPLWYASGFYPRSTVSPKPAIWLWAYGMAMYLLWYYIHWSPVMKSAWYANAFLWAAPCVLLVHNRWQHVVFLGWAGLDMIYLVTGWHSHTWNIAILCIGFLRSWADTRPDRK